MVILLLLTYKIQEHNVYVEHQRRAKRSLAHRHQMLAKQQAKQ